MMHRSHGAPSPSHQQQLRLNPSTPTSSYPTAEYTPLRSPPILQSRQNSSPALTAPKLVDTNSIYQQRIEFPEERLVFEDVPLHIVEDLQRGRLCCRFVYSPFYYHDCTAN